MRPIALPFGRATMTLEVPDDAVILQARAAPAVGNLTSEISNALANPIGSPSLREIAKGKASAVIVLSDFTRPVPHKILLPTLLDELSRAGVSRSRTTLLFACGLHRPMKEEEVVENVGREIADAYRIVNHNAADEGSLAYLGILDGQIPLWISRHFLQADLRILTGLIEPHLMAGFSGGCKVMAPGIAGDETIKELHSPQFLEDPRCREGELEENPLQKVIREIGQKARADFLLNVTLNENRQITGVFTGHPMKAHDAGVAFCRQCQQVECEVADVVVMTSAGWPLDATFYQAIKGLTAALPALKTGGTLLLVSECSEGLGSAPFREELAGVQDAAEYVRRITCRYEVKIDQWQIEELCRVLLRGKVVVYSPRLLEEYAGTLFEITDNLTDAFNAMLSKAPNGRVAVIPQGPYVLLRGRSTTIS
ncbi:MAG: nickel-dependent lactate racemase [bacterium]